MRGRAFSSFAPRLCSSFALVALCRTCTRDAVGGFKALLNALYTLLMACTLVLVASSFYRLMLYEQAFSYTRLRIYVQAFLILLGILCLYYIAHIWHAWKYFRQIAGNHFPLRIAWPFLLQCRCLYRKAEYEAIG